MPTKMQEKYIEIYENFKKSNQDHVFHYYDSLTSEQKEELLKQLSQIDPQRISQIYKNVMAQRKDNGISLEPLPKDCYDDIESVTQSTRDNWKTIGLEAIKKGKVAIILLAGGQGTRLGSKLPKGCYDIGLPSKKSLFQLQGERISRLQHLTGGVLPWYVMTSGPTRADTEAFFKEKNYFNLKKENIIFFEQGVLPALTPDGKIILEDKDKVSVAPDGNGGIYAGLRNCQIIEDMEKRGIEFIHAYCVDNCLVRVGDPIFIGYCISKQSLCGAKVVKKAYPQESVGVVCKVNGKFGVVEYSEISKEDAEKRDPSGRLVYDAANVANHFYTLNFLKETCSREFESKLEFHIANKKIKHIDLKTNEVISPSKPNGIKLELFIFDIFPLIPEGKEKTPFAVLSVPRSEDFSPLKNAPGAGADCPETSKKDLFTQSLKFIQDNGCKIEASPAAHEKIKVKETVYEASTSKEIEREVDVIAIEISPLVSYSGEGLEIIKGKKINLEKPTNVDSLDTLKKLIQ